MPGISRETASLVQTYEADVYGLSIVLIVLFAPGGIGTLFKRRQKAGEGS